MLHYEISGKGTENLILLHGFMENLMIWEDMETKFSDKFRLIKIDLPGHGRSAVQKEVSIESMAENVKEVAEHLKIEDFHILGHSMGGYVALAFAEKYPEVLKTLTLFFSTSSADSDEKKSIRKRSIKTIDENFETFVNLSIPNLFSENEKDILEGKINLAKEIALSTQKEGVKSAQLAMAERTDRTNVFKNFEGKILIFAGKHDHAVNAKELLKIVPEKTNIKTYVLDCGHNGYWEKPTICAEIINTELLHNLPKNLVL